MIPSALLARDSRLRYCMDVLGPLRLSCATSSYGIGLFLDCQPVQRWELLLEARRVHAVIAKARAKDPERAKIPWAADESP